MSLKSVAAKIFANYIYNKTQRWANNPIATQQKVFEELIIECKEITRHHKKCLEDNL